ncbi:hypothetical protein CWE04_11520 [Thomasclavelia cocleata]|uniref:hypothetical protein n=1 Tax=Thomasclavelia cocleata TaxID=69824 RepID=UPI000C27DDAE|nr:hypothetical protein [Thomasclavelia cocleata]PJN79832.1 hypothetical protein CWE04_11520 [Thomasclavelia cocleata]
MELNYIQYDKRFEYGNIIEDGIKFISDSRFYKVLENSNLSNEKKAILLALYEGLELKTISKIRKSSIIKKNELVMLGDGEYFKKNITLEIDENEIAVSRNLVEILKSLEFVHTRYSGYKAFPLKCYKDYIFKTVHINNVSKKFENDSQYENYLRKSIGRFIRDDVANLFKCSIDELRISGIVNFVCSNLKEENFQKNKVKQRKDRDPFENEGYKNSGFYWEITYRNLIEDYYNNQGK